MKTSGIPVVEPTSRKDGRRAMTVYLRPDLAKELKMKALSEDRHAYLLVEEMIENGLKNSN